MKPSTINNAYAEKDFYLKSPSSAAMLEGFTFPSAPETSGFQPKQASFTPYLEVSPFNTEAAGDDYE